MMLTMMMMMMMYNFHASFILQNYRIIQTKTTTTTTKRKKNIENNILFKKRNLRIKLMVKWFRGKFFTFFVFEIRTRKTFILLCSIYFHNPCSVQNVRFCNENIFSILFVFWKKIYSFFLKFDKIIYNLTIFFACFRIQVNNNNNNDDNDN